MFRSVSLLDFDEMFLSTYGRDAAPFSYNYMDSQMDSSLLIPLMLMLAFTPFSLLYSLSFSSNPFLAHSPFLVWGRVSAAAVNVNNVAESWVTAGGALHCESDGKLFGKQGGSSQGYES